MTRINITIDGALLAKVQTVLPGKRSRSNWISKAIAEKIERDKETKWKSY